MDKWKPITEPPPKDRLLIVASEGFSSGDADE
jgi:hypothetical protein